MGGCEMTEVLPVTDPVANNRETDTVVAFPKCGEDTASGIGAELAETNGAVIFASLSPGGPAAASGMIRAGDKLMRIGNQNVGPPGNLGLIRAVELLDGESGSTVRVRVQRDGKYIFDVCLERAAASAQNRLLALAERSRRCGAPRKETGPSAAERIYAGAARLNAALASDARPHSEEKMSADELVAWRAARLSEEKSAETVARRRQDGGKRRRAELAVLRRELAEKEATGAAFAEQLDLQAWISRLEAEAAAEEADEGSGAAPGAGWRALQAAEAAAEQAELEERVAALRLTLAVVEGAGAGASGTQGELTAVREKLAVAERRLARLLGKDNPGEGSGSGLGHQRSAALPAQDAAATEGDAAAEAEGAGSQDALPDGVGADAGAGVGAGTSGQCLTLLAAPYSAADGAGSAAPGGSVTAGLAAELRLQWREAEDGLAPCVARPPPLGEMCCNRRPMRGIARLSLNLNPKPRGWVRGHGRVELADGTLEEPPEPCMLASVRAAPSQRPARARTPRGALEATTGVAEWPCHAGGLVHPGKCGPRDPLGARMGRRARRTL